MELHIMARRARRQVEPVEPARLDDPLARIVALPEAKQWRLLCDWQRIKVSVLARFVEKAGEPDREFIAKCRRETDKAISLAEEAASQARAFQKMHDEELLASFSDLIRERNALLYKLRRPSLAKERRAWERRKFIHALLLGQDPRRLTQARWEDIFRQVKDHDAALVSRGKGKRPGDISLRQMKKDYLLFVTPKR
jgi:hypothetical protein